MTPPSLAFVDGLVLDVAAGTRTPTEALAALTARGLNPDREQLAEAVATVQLRQHLADGTADPLLLTEGAAVSPWVDRRAMAERLLDDRLEESERVLARLGRTMARAS